MKMTRMERVKWNIKYFLIWESRECKSNGKCLSLFTHQMMLYPFNERIVCAKQKGKVELKKAIVIIGSTVGPLNHPINQDRIHSFSLSHRLNIQQKQ